MGDICPIPHTSIGDFSWSWDSKVEIISRRTCKSIWVFLDDWERYNRRGYTTFAEPVKNLTTIGFTAYVEHKEIGVTMDESVDIRLSAVRCQMGNHPDAFYVR